MTKKQLKRRVRGLEHHIGIMMEQQNVILQRVADLEEIVFDVESIELSFTDSTPDKSLN